MGLIDAIFDFFIRLFRQRTDAIEFRAKAKLKSMQTRAKSQAANRVNKAIDGTANKAKKKITRK